MCPRRFFSPLPARITPVGRYGGARQFLDTARIRIPRGDCLLPKSAPIENAHAPTISGVCSGNSLPIVSTHSMAPLSVHRSANSESCSLSSRNQDSMGTTHPLSVPPSGPDNSRSNRQEAYRFLLSWRAWWFWDFKTEPPNGSPTIQ